MPPYILLTKILSPSKITTVSSHSFKALGRYSDICGRIEDYPSKACGLPPGLAGREKKDCGRDKGTLTDSDTIRSHFVYDTQSEGRCARNTLTTRKKTQFDYNNLAWQRKYFARAICTPPDKERTRRGQPRGRDRQAGIAEASRSCFGGRA